MNKEAILEELGLNPLEAQVYLALIKLGGEQASAIAKEVGVKRTTIYDVLSSLTKKGFATVYFRKSKRVYHAQQPQRVADIFQRKLTAFTDLIPLLTVVEKQQVQGVGLRLIQTREELEKFHEDMVIDYAHKSYDVIGSASGFYGAFRPDFMEKFRRDRAKAKIRMRLLLTDDSRVTEPSDPNPLRVTRFLPKGFAFESNINIYPDKILMISPRMTSLAVVIEIPAMTDIFHSIFELLWEGTKD